MQVSPEFVLNIVGETVDRARNSWPQIARHLPKELKASLEAHSKNLAKEFRIA
jgi:hypothetical protein